MAKKKKDIFDKLVKNKTFVKEAKEARKRILQNSDKFVNFTEKYKHLIK